MTWRAITVFTSTLVFMGLTGIGSVAHAADHPPFMPTRDVAVAYLVQASQLTSVPAASVPPGPHTVKMIYSAASGRVRIEQPSMPGYMLIDRAAGRITMVMDQLQSFMDMPFDARAGAGLLLNDKMAFTRIGADRVAGVTCILWSVTSDKTTAKLCVTQDGVILRGEGSDPKRGEGKLLATAVTYASQPIAMFSPPPGFHRMELPVMPPGFGGKPGKFPG